MVTKEDEIKFKNDVLQGKREEISAYVKHELKWKSATTRHCRARLCLRGFKDSQKTELDTFANTVARTTQRIICSCAALCNWKLTALDVSTAFLQGLKYGDQGRVIHFKVDAEITALLRELPGFEDLDHNTEVLKLLESAYGLVYAPKRWFESLTLVLKEANWKATLLDPALYHHNTLSGELKSAARWSLTFAC
eukprot:6478188-Amphidinium_carterae.1